MSLLEISHLRKSYGELVAVQDVGFSIERGEIFGLLGPNGAGKSTTMMMLAGLIPPDSGTITLKGELLHAEDRARRKILGVVPQELSIYPNLTASENLRFFGRLYGVSHSELKTRMDSVLARIGLSDRSGDLTDTFSGGMKRRLNFGAALLHEPELLILDEPTVGVDPQSRSHLMDCIRDLAEEGVAVLYASHYMEEVEALCSRIAIIDHGQMVACDRLDVLLSQTESRLELTIDQLPDNFNEWLASGVEVHPADAQHRHPRITLNNPTAPLENKSRDGDQGHHPSIHTRLLHILNLIEETGAKLISVDSQDANLEQLFLQLTGHRLRD
ncbi:MAG: linearmycin resistance ATP-binding protein LnrL [Planctomycetaceae bacterium]